MESKRSRRSRRSRRCELSLNSNSFLFLIANIVTTSKALVTSSDALVPSSFLFGFEVSPPFELSFGPKFPSVTPPWAATNRGDVDGRATCGSVADGHVAGHVMV